MINEVQRRAYLEAMGIECYVPRLQLPGAKVSVLCEMPDLPVGERAPESPSAEAAVTSTAAPSPPPGQSNAAGLRDLLATDPGTKSAKRTATKEAEAGRESAPRSIPRFSLSVVRGGQLLIVDEGLAGDSDPQAYLRLIHNLLFALGVPQPELAIDAFRWPMARLRGHHVDQSELAARQALQAYLSKQLEQSGSQYLVLMGDTPRQYIGIEGARGGDWQQQAQLPVSCIATQSASRALSEGAIKRAIWRDLQPLAQTMCAKRN